MSIDTLSAPADTDRDLTTHRFRGGPYDQFVVTFPRRSLLDDPNVHFLIIPKNTSLESLGQAKLRRCR
jgi:hypothetical protein